MFCVLVFLIFATSTFGGVVPEGDSLCSEDQFQSQNGTCIPCDGKCGTVDQSAGSTDLSQFKNNHDEASLTNVTACILPPYPKQGKYRMENKEDAEPGQRIMGSLVLKVSCRRGFGVRTPDGDMTSPNRHEVYCISGNWIQRMPKCVRFCKLNQDPSLRYMCHINGEGFKTCSGYLPPGTSVKPICRSPLYYSNTDLSYMNCVSGFWDNLPHCKAECGRITPEGEELVIGGRMVNRGELPWHVGIYRKTTGTPQQICGGTILSNNVVLSAAHCFWSDVKKQLPAEQFAVAAGKLRRHWSSDKDIGSQKSDVKEITIPKRFKGAATNFQDDVAVVIVASPFTYKTYIRPVCLDFDSGFERLQLLRGKMGKVAGWGLTATDGNPSPLLNVVDMPFVEIDTCIETLPKSFTEYITSDKFCAGHLNGTAVCKGDSGGGLVFPDKEHGIDRYYLRGVVSTAPTLDMKQCNDETYATFTTITKHEEFIKGAMADNMKKTCPQYLFQCADGTCMELGIDCDGVMDCADGSDEYEDLCNLEPEESSMKPQCVLPPYPEHGAYRVLEDPYAQPGQALESPVLRVFCLRLIGTRSETLTDYDTIACNEGKWSGEMPNCLTDNYCNKTDGTIGQCIDYNMCYEFRTSTYEKYGDDAKACHRQDEVCCAKTERTWGGIPPGVLASLLG